MLPSEFTATVNADLTVGALEETITVTGEAPMVDIRSSRAQVQFAQETLQSLPGAGRLTTLSTVLPGATLRRENDRGVGRPERSHADGLQRPRRAGSAADHGRDESPDCEPDLGRLRLQPDQHPGSRRRDERRRRRPRYRRHAAQHDQQGRRQHLLGHRRRSPTSGPSLETSNITDELLARGLDPQRVGSIKKFRDSAVAIGGPIKRDRLWFFAAFREGVTQQYAEGVYYNKLKQPASLLYEPDLSRPAFTDDYSRDFSLRFTWQAAAKHKIVLATRSSRIATASSTC